MNPAWASGGVQRRRKGSPWRGLAALFLVLGAALIAWQMLLPRLLRPAHPEAADDNGLATQLAHLKLLGRALKLHADEHDGKFPAVIADIEWRQTLPGMNWDGLPAAASRFRDPQTGRAREWIYFPGKTTSDPPETILAASPVAIGPGGSKRLVVRLSNVAEIIPEQDFHRQTSEQGTP